MQRLRSNLFTMTALMLSASTTLAEIDNFSVASGLTYGYASEQNLSMQGELEIMPAVDVALAPNVSLVASARIRLDANDELEPPGHAYDTYSGASRPIGLGEAGRAEVRDFYFESRSEYGLARIGKQQIVWGRLDGIKVLDLVNPEDFSEFILDDFGDSRIGLWSAYFDYSIGHWRAELALVPDSSGHAIPAQGAWYELNAPRFRFGAGQNQGALPVSTTRPGLSLRDAAVGLRLSRQLGVADFSAVAYSGMDPEPLGRIISIGGEAVVERFYERRNAIGLSADLGLGSAVIRAEYAYQPERVFNTRANNRLTTLSLDQHRAAIGADLEAPLGLFVNVQYLFDSVADAPSELVRPATDRVGTLLLRRTFAYDALSLEARWYYSFTDKDRLASASVAYALDESTTIRLGADYFAGTAAGLFGQFADRDRVTVKLSHIF